MKPRIEIIEGKKLVGQRLKMSLQNNRISQLWKNFGPKRHGIKNCVNNELISLAVYSPDHFKKFNPANEFERWATVEVSNYTDISSDFETFDLQKGLYAVFEYKGLNTSHSIFQYIFKEWLPNSEFELDKRPHFEILGDKYKNNNPDSEEDIYIPIRDKSKKL